MPMSRATSQVLMPEPCFICCRCLLSCAVLRFALLCFALLCFALLPLPFALLCLAARPLVPRCLQKHLSARRPWPYCIIDMPFCPPVLCSAALQPSPHAPFSLAPLGCCAPLRPLPTLSTTPPSYLPSPQQQLSMHCLHGAGSLMLEHRKQGCAGTPSYRRYTPSSRQSDHSLCRASCFTSADATLPA
jgi:hypothetical protein